VKILILGPEAVQVFRFRRDLAADLMALGHQVLLGAPPGGPNLVSAIRRSGMGFEPLPLARAGLDPLKDLGFLLALRRLILRERPDVLLFTTLKPVLYGSLAARACHRGPYFSMISGAGSLFMGTSPPKRLLRALVKPFLRLALSGNKALFFQNPDDLALFVGKGLVPDPSRAVLIAGSGVPLREFPASPVPNQPPRFLYVGRFLREKGIEDFAQAASFLKARHPRARFQALGDLDPNPGSVGPGDLERWRAQGALEILAPVPDVRPALRRCSVFVLPSYYREGVPRSALEALSTGRAVVTADSPGSRETVREGRNGFLVPPRDPEALARAMERFILEPSLARRMGRASRRLAEGRFDVRKVNRVILRTMGLGKKGA
jgi:glycosyltransferase involved in cell wall biosynthesis